MLPTSLTGTSARLKSAACFALLVACSCAGAETRSGVTAAEPERTDVRALVAEAAAGAKAWGVVGPHVLWAPLLCMAPPPPSAHVSRAPDAGPHAHKLFVLRSNDPEAYLKLTGPDTSPGEVPLGLTLVKESYAPIEVDPATVPPPRVGIDHYATQDGFYRFAKRNGKTYRTGGRRDLFVMVRVAPGTPDSERGWVYGTVTPEGEVTSAGRVASCIECHSDVEAGADSLFGVQFR